MVTSSNIRKLIVERKSEGKENRDIAKWLGVSERTVRRVLQKHRETGSYKRNPANSGRKPLVSEERVALKIKEIPDITLLELIDELELPISESALCRRVNKLGLRVKKNSSPKCVKMSPRNAGNGPNIKMK